MKIIVKTTTEEKVYKNIWKIIENPNENLKEVVFVDYDYRIVFRDSNSEDIKKIQVMF